MGAPRVRVMLATALAMTFGAVAVPASAQPAMPATVPAAATQGAPTTAQTTPIVIPKLRSANGITVTGDLTMLTERTFFVPIATNAIDAVYATKSGSLTVRVTVPPGYDPGHNTYPVLYLLHGQDGQASDWTQAAINGQAMQFGDVEAITAHTPMIIVTPDGGKAGWYTDWVNSAQAQQWEVFHIHQLIGWVDANLATVPQREGRAIAGLSMGGFGAFHYATRYPELFAHVSSYSGGLDLENQAIRTAVIGSAALQKLAPIDGAFGPALWPLDRTWVRHNPVRHAAALAGMGVSIYAGDGLGPADPWMSGGEHLTSIVIERQAAWSSLTLSQALNRAGVPHRFVRYGHPGQVGAYLCNGLHTFGCWNMALSHDLPNIVAAIGGIRQP